jgi:TonB family protein
MDLERCYIRVMWKAIAVLLVLCASSALAQESVPALGGASDKGQRVFDQRMPGAGNKPPTATVQVLSDSTAVDEMPSYPGGRNEMLKFIWANMVYPDSAWTAGIGGHVYVSFMVDTDGTISDPTVLRGIGGGCDEEALRLVAAMPKWLPARQNGEPVRTQTNLPILFKLRCR